jgi:hypothetical protein
MAVGCGDKSNKICFRPENASERFCYKVWPFGRLRSPLFRRGIVVSVWTYTFNWYSKNMASTGVFVFVVCALKHLTSGHGRQQSMILTQIKHKQSRSYQKMI